MRARAARTPGRGGRGRAWLCAALLALTPPVLAASPADSLRAETAIAAMHRYLAGAVDEEGWFLYRHDAQGRRLPGYNIVRHAGTLLAMSQGLSSGADDPAARRAIAAATRRLIDCCLAPAGVGDGALAVWWPPPPGVRAPESASIGAGAERIASLGAAALGLIALIAADRQGLQAVPVETLRGLGRFLLAMQSPDGSFRSRWFADGRSDDWRSLYYPGEAALALVWLAQAEPSAEQAARWRRGAIDALLALAQERRGRAPTPPDHWALIATGALACSGAPLAGHETDALASHAWQVARGMLAEQAAVAPFSGGFLDDDRMTPTATRLEGLLALGAWPLPGEPARRLSAAAGAGIGWLLSAIPVEGALAGAVPRHRATPLGLRHERATEVRIDYVQHALTALLLAREQARGASVCGLLLPPPARRNTPME